MIFKLLQHSHPPKFQKRFPYFNKLFFPSNNICKSFQRRVCCSFNYNFTEGNCIFFQKRAISLLAWRSPKSINIDCLELTTKFSAYIPRIQSFACRGTFLHTIWEMAPITLPKWLYFRAFPNTMEQCSFFF